MTEQFQPEVKTENLSLPGLNEKKTFDHVLDDRIRFAVAEHLKKSQPEFEEKINKSITKAKHEALTIVDTELNSFYEKLNKILDSINEKLTYLGLRQDALDLEQGTIATLLRKKDIVTESELNTTYEEIKASIVEATKRAHALAKEREKPTLALEAEQAVEASDQ
jgi:uncharacterized protein YecT (DUF1311 family)